MSGPTKGMVAGKAIKTDAQSKEFDEGFDRIFGKERKPVEKGRFVYSQEAGQVVKVGSDWTDAERRAATPTEGITYANLRATDGTPIDSRTKHREYMRANGLSMASDFSEHWKKADKQRQEVLSGNADTRERRELIGRTLHDAKRGRK